MFAYNVSGFRKILTVRKERQGNISILEILRERIKPTNHRKRQKGGVTPAKSKAKIRLVCGGSGGNEKTILAAKNKRLKTSGGVICEKRQ